MLVLAHLGNYISYLEISLAPLVGGIIAVVWWEEIIKMELLMEDFQQVCRFYIHYDEL